MTHLQAHHDLHDIRALRREIRRGGQLQQAQVMVLAAGLAAFGIVAVAAAMMTTLL